jgi:Family of unknown function (DUF6524)
MLVLLRVLVLGTLVWMSGTMGFSTPIVRLSFPWVSLIVIGIILGIGLSWSLRRARITGQVEVD